MTNLTERAFEAVRGSTPWYSLRRLRERLRQSWETVFVFGDRRQETMILDFDSESIRRRAHNNYETGRFFNSLVTPYAHAMMPDQDRCVKCGMTAEQIEDQETSVCSVEY